MESTAAVLEEGRKTARDDKRRPRRASQLAAAGALGRGLFHACPGALHPDEQQRCHQRPGARLCRDTADG